MKLNKILFGSLAMTAIAFASCSNEESLNLSNTAEDLVFGNGSEIVTLSLTPEAANLGTRADDPRHISDGTGVDVLMFTVYEKEGENWKVSPEFKKSNEEVKGITPGYGQNILEKSLSDYPTVIKLATDPAKTYKVAFWAQDSKCNAFKTKDLEHVEVVYAKALNNDELRDAFCAVSAEISAASKESTSQEIILHRPFAQINVGTTGADFNKVLQDENYFPNKQLKYSKIELEGVCNQLDILGNSISCTEGFNGNITYDWNFFPAWTFNALPTTPTVSDILGSANSNEEFLNVRLNPNDTQEALRPFKTEYPTYDPETKAYLTDQFKYLSMCYVLVAATEEKVNGQPTKPATYKSSTLDKVTVYFAENENGTDNYFDEEGDIKTQNAYAYLSLQNVPVCRNWRTNIIGGLNDDDDDETSLFSNTRLCVHLCPIYDGEFNHVNNQKDAEGVTIWTTNLFPHPTVDNEGNPNSDTLHDQHETHKPAATEPEAPGA